MYRKSRFIVVALAAAAIAPAAHAGTAPPGWTVTTDDQGLEWLVPTGPAATVTPLCTPADTGWITVTDDQGLSWLEPTGSQGSSSCASKAAVQGQVLVAKSKKAQKPLSFTSENAPSQNRIARRNAA